MSKVGMSMQTAMDILDTREGPYEVSDVLSGFFLDGDDDGHWYVIPVTMRKQWQTWINRAAGDPEPSWALPVDDPSKVIFPSFTIPDDTR